MAGTFDMNTPRDVTVVGLPSQGLRHLLGSRLAGLLVGLNLAGVFLYLRLASFAWRRPEEVAAGIDSVTGEPFVWAGFVYPIWAIFLLLNAAWFIISRRRRQQARVAAYLLITLGWIVGLAIDFAHH